MMNWKYWKYVNEHGHLLIIAETDFRSLIFKGWLYVLNFLNFTRQIKRKLILINSFFEGVSQLKKADKLHFTQYSYVVIILLNTGLHKSASPILLEK